MIIRIRRSGGFAGIEEELGPFDTSGVTKEEATRIEGCVESLARSIAAAGTGGIGADMFRYDIEVDDRPNGKITLSLADEGKPESPLHHLLDALGVPH